MSEKKTEELTKLRPRDLVGYEGQLFARNLSRSQIIHDQDGKSLSLGPAGSPSDAAYLNIDIARTQGFQKIWRRGLVEVITDVAFEEYIEKQEIEEQKAEDERLAKVHGSIEPSPQSKDLIQTTDEFGEIAFETEGERDARESSVTTNVVDAEGNMTEIVPTVTMTPTLKG